MSNSSSMTISQAIGSPTDVVPITLNFNVENAVEVRYGATAQEASLSSWKPYSTTIQTYGRGDEDSSTLDYYAEVKLANNSIVYLHALEPTRLSGTPHFPVSSINTNFSTWHDHWVSYGYQGTNTFYALTHEATQVWVDDSRWQIDYPETPDTVLFALTYVDWITEGVKNSIDLTGAKLSVDFDLSGIDLKEGQIDFWVLAEDDVGHGRYHYFANPIQDGYNLINLDFDAFENSWLNNERPLNSIALDETHISSWGFSFSGFSEKPIGIIKFDNFQFIWDNIINGTDGDDSLYGNAADNEIYAFAGNDKMWGYGGNDLFFGSSGADIFTGGADIDTVAYLYSDEGVNVFLNPSYQNFGGTATGDLFGSIENVIGSNHADYIYGDHENNNFYGQAGDDLLWGYEGDDYFYNSLGADIYTGGTGIDTATYNGANDAVNVDLATGGTLGEAEGDLYGSIENIIGSQFNDIILGDNGDNFLFGQGGDDLLSGATGNDVLRGEDGQDTLIGGSGNDKFLFIDVAASTPTNPDIIADFLSGDLIDLTSFDANTTLTGNQQFIYINGDFTSTPGELHVVNNNSNWVIEGDINGDSLADLQILSVNQVSENDFLL